jgi:hypothetical protein
MGLTGFEWEREPESVPASNNSPAAKGSEPAQSLLELKDESRKIRRLQMVVNMVTQVILQDPTMTVEEASAMVADTRRAALAMFPDKELAFNLIYWPRLQRVMRERFRMH